MLEIGGSRSSFEAWRKRRMLARCARGDGGVLAHEVPGTGDPGAPHADGDHEHGGGPAQVAATGGAVGVEGDRAMLDLLGAVPPQQRHHLGIGAGAVEAAGDDDPPAQHRGEVLDGGDRGELRQQVATVGPGPDRRRQPRPHGPGPGDVEAPLDEPGEPGGIDALGGQVVEHHIVGPGVGGLLADEGLHIAGQTLLVDERQRPLVDLHEPTLAGRQQEVQDVGDVGGVRVAGHPVLRRARVVERDPAGHEPVATLGIQVGRQGGGHAVASAVGAFRRGVHGRGVQSGAAVGVMAARPSTSSTCSAMSVAMRSGWVRGAQCPASMSRRRRSAAHWATSSARRGAT